MTASRKLLICGEEFSEIAAGPRGGAGNTPWEHDYNALVDIGGAGGQRQALENFRRLHHL